MTVDQVFLFATGFAWGALALHVFHLPRRRLEPGICQCGHGRHVHRLGLHSCAELIAWEPVPGAVRTCPCMHYIADPAAARHKDFDLEELRAMTKLEDRR